MTTAQHYDLYSKQCLWASIITLYLGGFIGLYVCDTDLEIGQAIIVGTSLVTLIFFGQSLWCMEQETYHKQSTTAMPTTVIVEDKIDIDAVNAA